MDYLSVESPAAANPYTYEFGAKSYPLKELRKRYNTLAKLRGEIVSSTRTSKNGKEFSVKRAKTSKSLINPERVIQAKRPKSANLEQVVSGLEALGQHFGAGDFYTPPGRYQTPKEYRARLNLPKRVKGFKNEYKANRIRKAAALQAVADESAAQAAHDQMVADVAAQQAAQEVEF
jgi:hypothetical protein